MGSASLYELDFHVEGVVYVACDICLEEMGMPIQNDGKLTARLGEENVEDGDMVIVDKEDGVLDASWYVYELIALAIPIKHVHEPGQCDPAMVAKLQQLSADGERPGEVESIRRTHDKAVVPTLAICPNCGAYYVYHTVCATCGYYRGKVAVVKEAAE